jgi:hypothetical protein
MAWTAGRWLSKRITERRGLETITPVRDSADFASVAAVYRSGRELGRSRTIRLWFPEATHRRRDFRFPGALVQGMGAWRRMGVLVVAASVLGGAAASSAHAASVVVLSRDGHATVRQDRFLRSPAITPTPAKGPVMRTRARTAQARSVPQVLSRLRRLGAITASAYRRYRAIYAAALGAVGRLQGTRALELRAVIANVSGIAAAGLLTQGRLPALFETLDRNRQWWTTGPLLAPYQRVEFAGSQLVWEYYPGQGIELQVLGTFATADALYTSGRANYPRLRQLLAEMIPLATRRAGGMTWEYYFDFDGGSPPWTSAMSQGTGIEALTRAFRAFKDPSYLQLAHSALAVFTRQPGVGVAVPTPRGSRYVQYTFTPGTEILNAFLQSLIGLYDYAQASGDPLAERLFAAGDAEARWEVPHFDTGAWSLYQPGVEDSLDYHTLVTGFLQELCQRTKAPVYCITAQHFQAYLKTPPALTLLTSRIAARRAGTIRFRLSKYSHVGIVVLRGTRTVFDTSADFGYGVRALSVPALKRGSYTIRLAATDLAGNFSQITGTLRVS